MYKEIIKICPVCGKISHSGRYTTRDNEQIGLCSTHSKSFYVFDKKMEYIEVDKELASKYYSESIVKLGFVIV